MWARFYSAYNPPVKKSLRASVRYEDVRQAALLLPNVEEGTAWGLPAFRKNGQLFLCFRKDLGSIVVRTTFEARDSMIEEDPETYYTTDHHRPHPWVLARIAKLQGDVVPGLVQMGWQMTPKKPAKRGKAKKY